MNIYETLCEDINSCTVSRDRNLLKLIKGDVENELKRNKKYSSIDDVTIKIIKSFIKNINIFKNSVTCHAKIDELEHEKALLSKYMPAELTANEILAIVSINKFSTFGDCIKFFKDHYANQYDAILVKNVFCDYT